MKKAEAQRIKEVKKWRMMCKKVFKFDANLLALKIDFSLTQKKLTT